jgi:hypothetical protein
MIRLPVLLLGTVASLALPGLPIADTVAPAPVRAEYSFDGKTSRLTVETETVGLASMFGHDHKFVARDFTGTLTLDRSSRTRATRLTARSPWRCERPCWRPANIRRSPSAAAT